MHWLGRCACRRIIHGRRGHAGRASCCSPGKVNRSRRGGICQAVQVGDLRPRQRSGQEVQRPTRLEQARISAVDAVQDKYALLQAGNLAVKGRPIHRIAGAFQAIQ